MTVIPLTKTCNFTHLIRCFDKWTKCILRMFFRGPIITLHVPALDQQRFTSTGRSTATSTHELTVTNARTYTRARTHTHTHVHKHNVPWDSSTSAYLTRLGAMPAVSTNNHQSPVATSIPHTWPYAHTHTHTHTHTHKHMQHPTRWSTLVSQ